MELSIVIISWNTADLLKQCLQAVRTSEAGLDYEVIVVDNGSSDGSAEMVEREFPDTTLIRNGENRGFAAANNQAIAISRGRHVLLLNSDAILRPSVAKQMVEALDANPRVGAVGAQLLNADGSFQYSYADFPTVLGELLLVTKLSRFVLPSTYPSYPSEQSNQPRDVDWVSGACLMVRREAIAEVGGLDEGYFMYSEETDWCYRLRRAGWLVRYLSSARVIHLCGQSARKAAYRKRSQLYRSKTRFFRKHYGVAAATAFLLGVQVVAALKLVACGVGCLVLHDDARQRCREVIRSHGVLLVGR